MKKLMLILAAMALVTTSAYAADWNFYGSARIMTWYQDVDTNTAARDTTNLTHTMQGNSRIGARVNVSDELTARFEYGTGVNVRILYGEWNFGAGKMLVGQTYSPLNMFYSSQVFMADEGLLSTGGVYSGRHPMVRFTFGDFKIALVEPANATVGPFAVGEQVIPKIEASYRFNAENWHVAVQGGYNTYEIVRAATTLDVDSYIAAIGAGLDAGAFYVGANLWFGQNVGNYGLYNAPADDAGIDAVGRNVIDNDAFGYLLTVGYTFNDMFYVEAGYSAAEAELDTAGATSDEITSFYVQTNITLAPGVFVVPEIGMIDNEEANTSETLYYGLKWQINF